MNTRLVHLSGWCLVAAAATVVATTAAPAYAHATPDRPQTLTPIVAANSVHSITDRLARQVAVSLADRGAATRIVAAVADGTADLSRVAAGSPLAHAVLSADRAVRAAKGLPAGAPDLLRLRLADPVMAAALARGALPLVAATPTDDSVTSLTAYNPAGSAVTLDAATVPTQPVLLVEVDTATALSLGARVMRETLAQRGVLPSATAATAPAATGGYWATKVDAIRLSNDEEPWFKGAAEIFDVVSGFGLDGVPKVDIVQMPYLDYDNTTYYPNQLIVHFSAYKYNLADVVMWEDDGDTNYQSLAIAIADALLTIADQGVYVPLVNAIINAMPNSWWTDDPDYTDSWYTLSTTSHGRLYGASANGWMDVEPYWVSEL